MGIIFGDDRINFDDDDWRIRADGNTLYVENKVTGQEFRFVDSPDSGDEVARITDIEANSGVNFDNGTGPMALPFHMTEYAQGLSNAEIARTSLATGKQLEVWRLETRFQGGGTNPDFTVDIFDEDTSTVLASTSSRNVASSSSPIGTSSDGGTVLLRVTNATSSSRNASISGLLNVVEV